MDKIRIKKENLYKRETILDEMTDVFFDGAAIVDANCNIIHLSKRIRQDTDSKGYFIGKHISALDEVSPFERVIKTCKASKGMLLNIRGKSCISSVYPIVDGDETIGAIGTIVYRNLKDLKDIFVKTNEPLGDEEKQIYSVLSRSKRWYNFDDFVGESPEVHNLKEKAIKAAGSRLPILIIGETGTGKEIIAAAIHKERSISPAAPYVTINCTAIPSNLLESELFGHEKGSFTGATTQKIGKFETASGGDILLDEIGDMDLNMQAKLLRVLESKEFERVGGSKIIPMNAGIIASTNKNLYLESMEKNFRSDLYYRLNTIELYIPPLRERREDIPLLINKFCDDIDADLNISDEAMGLLKEYSWPGNVRQLRNFVHRLSIFHESDLITGDEIIKELMIGQKNYNDVALNDEFSSNKNRTVEDAEYDAILAALDRNKGNISAAARELGISRGTVYNKLKK